jgi:hypothetical protein
LDAKGKADVLESSNALAEAHEESAKEGQTQAPNIEDDVNTHFIAFVEKDGHLYELYVSFFFHCSWLSAMEGKTTQSTMGNQVPTHFWRLKAKTQFK